VGYYRTGDFYRMRGDFYRAHRRGDPGFFDFLGGIASKVLPIAAPIIGGAIGGPVGAALGGVVGGLAGNVMGATAPGSTSMPVVSSPMLQIQPFRSMVPSLVGGAAGAVGGTLVTRALGTAEKYIAGKAKKGFHALVGGGARHHRRMNPLNPRALRRALRRAKGFEHFARGVLRITRPGPHKVHFKFPRRKRRVA